MAEITVALPQPPISEVPGRKMEHFREELVGVSVHLKGGEQNFSFALMIDPNDPKGERIINLPDSRPDKNILNADQWQRVGILQQENEGKGDFLVVTIGEIQRRVSKAELKRQSSKVWLNQTKGFEVLDFDPKTHEVIIHQINRLAPPVVPLVERKPGWRRKLIPFIPLIIGSGTAVIQRDSLPTPVIQQEPVAPSEPQLTKEDVTLTPPVIEGTTPEITTQELDESLRCPATKEFVIKAGGSLTRALVEVNGLGRYLTDEAKLNKDLLYKDLLCLIAQPENLQGLEKSDSKVADLLRDLNSQDSRNLIGSLTADMLSEALAKLNTNDPARVNLHDQLVIVQHGQTIQVPQFSHPGE